jgi:hypothetical protein
VSEFVLNTTTDAAFLLNMEAAAMGPLNFREFELEPTNSALAELGTD